MAGLTRSHKLIAAVSLPLALLAAVALLLMSEHAYRRSMTALQEASSASNVQLDLRAVSNLLVQAENGQRGYLISGDAADLPLYQSARRVLAGTLDRLGPHFAPLPEHAEFEALRNAVDLRLTGMAQVVALRQAAATDRKTPAVNLDADAPLRQQIALLITQLEAAESSRLQSRQTQVNDTLLMSRLGVAALTLLGLLAFSLYQRQTRRLTEQRSAQEATLRAERDSLEQQVQQRTRQLTELTRHLQTMQEAERSQLARELHDELGALLTAAKLDVARLKSRLPADFHDATDRVGHLNELLNSGIALKRRIIEDLRPSSLHHLGLAVSLDNLARDFSARSGIAVRARLAPVSLEERAELTAYRFVQEALANVAKYAKARTVDVWLQRIDTEVEVSVQDDGAGFDPHGVRSSAQGLIGLRYRIEALGGRMQLLSEPGSGVRLSARFPQKKDGGSTLAPPAVPDGTLQVQVRD